MTRPSVSLAGMTPSSVTVYPRDASWWSRPGTASAYHALGADEVTAACSSRIMLATEQGSRPDDVESLLCRHPACVARRTAVGSLPA